MKTFGENLRQIRLSYKLTQKQVGKEVGYSDRTVGDWENDKTEPNINAIKKLVKLFNISYDELFEF